MDEQKELRDRIVASIDTAKRQLLNANTAIELGEGLLRMMDAAGKPAKKLPLFDDVAEAPAETPKKKFRGGYTRVKSHTHRQGKKLILATLNDGWVATLPQIRRAIKPHEFKSDKVLMGTLRLLVRQGHIKSVGTDKRPRWTCK
jgi:hypothetical protein